VPTSCAEPPCGKLAAHRKTAGSAKGEAEEFQLIGRCPRAICQQIKALLAHVLISFDGEKLDAIGD
jgi:hypothetical protein